MIVKCIINTQELFSDPAINSPARVFKNVYGLEYDGDNKHHKALYKKLARFFKDENKVCSLEYLQNELHLGLCLATDGYIRALREGRDPEAVQDA